MLLTVTPPLVVMVPLPLKAPLLVRVPAPEVSTEPATNVVSPLKLTLPPPVVIDVLDTLIVFAKTLILPAVNPTVPGMVTPPSGFSDVPKVIELTKSGMELTATVSATLPRLTVSRILGFEDHGLEGCSS